MAAATYKTPGVYVEEITTLPPSVAEVATAVPAFIGYTQEDNPVVAEVKDLLDFETRFGKAVPTPFRVTTKDGAEAGTKVMDTLEFAEEGEHPKFLMNYALTHYFKNGGGKCYVVSVGKAEAGAGVQKQDLLAGLELLKKEDEPTLIVLTDAVKLAADDFYEVGQQALAQCEELKDRFVLFDVPQGNISDFRDKVGTSNLMYGAAYHPHLETSLNFHYREEDVTVVLGEGEENTLTDEAVKINQTSLYNEIKSALTKKRVTLPPSAAIAGIYARVDRTRGVWKAPANESIAATIGPTVKISTKDQEGLNVDPTAGKSINAIRAFAGKGTLVWGARTLAGNDNEWRYVAVRRLFITIEESIQKSTAFAVFEPNDATTWLKVKGMIESYLYGLWEKGALAGPTPESAYFVNVGLGKTMTPQDVLEGRLIVDVGVAAVRPAEFVVLRFMHKLQEA